MTDAKNQSNVIENSSPKSGIAELDHKLNNNVCQVSIENKILVLHYLINFHNSLTNFSVKDQIVFSLNHVN